MRINEYVDRCSDEIVKIVNDFDNINGFSQGFGNGRGLIGRTQLSNLLNASKNANSIEEIKLFIAYQASRSNGREGWNRQVGSKTISEEICSKIDKVLELANEEKLKEINALDLDKLVEIKLKLGEKFLGYLYWKGTIYSK